MPQACPVTKIFSQRDNGIERFLRELEAGLKARLLEFANCRNFAAAKLRHTSGFAKIGKHDMKVRIGF